MCKSLDSVGDARTDAENWEIREVVGVDKRHTPLPLYTKQDHSGLDS